MFLAFDLTKDKKTSDLSYWLEEINSTILQDATVFLIGCKADEEGRRQIQEEEARELCRRNKISFYYETSAKTGFNVEEVVVTAAKNAYFKELNQKKEKSKTDQ